MAIAITDVTGVGPSTATLLSGHGIGSAEALAQSSLKKLLSIPGFGPARARTVLVAAAQVVGEATATQAKKGKKGKEKKKQKDKKRKEEKGKKSEGKDAKGNKAKGKRRKKRKQKKSKE